MEENNNKKFPNNNRNPWMPHIIYASALVLICLIIVLTYVWAKNKDAETTRYQTEKNAEIQMQQQQSQLKEQESEQGRKQQTQRDRDICLRNASYSYSNSWSSACKSQAKFIENKIAGCINQGNTKADCQQSLGIPDYSGKCSLPEKVADSLEDNLKEAKEECYKSFSAE